MTYVPSIDVIANRIMMKRGVNKRRTFLVVEGDDDAKFFERHVDSAACYPQPAYGRERVVGAVVELKRRAADGILGVVDLDYLPPDGVEAVASDIVMTGHRDLECVLLDSDALSHVLVELSNREAVEAFELEAGRRVVDHLTALARPIGEIRYASCIQGWKLCFRHLRLVDFVDKKRWRLDRDRFVQELIRGQSAARITPPLPAEFDAGVQAARARHLSDWHICRGHDLVDILAVGLMRSIGANGEAAVSRDRLESRLRLAYEGALFLASILFERLREWEERNEPFRIFTRQGAAPQ